jgi:hypothetical protein
VQYVYKTIRLAIFMDDETKILNAPRRITMKKSKLTVALFSIFALFTLGIFTVSANETNSETNQPDAVAMTLPELYADFYRGAASDAAANDMRTLGNALPQFYADFYRNVSLGGSDMADVEMLGSALIEKYAQNYVDAPLSTTMTALGTALPQYYAGYYNTIQFSMRAGGETQMVGTALPQFYADTYAGLQFSETTGELGTALLQYYAATYGGGNFASGQLAESNVTNTFID